MQTLQPGDFDEAARRLREHGSFIFLKAGARYLDPGIPEEWSRLVEAGARDDEATWSAVVELLLERLPDLEPRIYFPVPMGRQRQLDAEVLLERFSYRMIVVDEDQNWTWNGSPVARRTREFFLEHVGYQPAVDRHEFEYQVNPDWIDRSYFEGATPLVARRLAVRDGVLEAELNNGRRDALQLSSFRLDDEERLLASSERHGTVRIDDNERFRLLRGVSEDLRQTTFEGLVLPLRHSGGEGAA